mmetsp:Transcript_2653/g.5391  ORF Transcript_2653/g.5391 Transcript_2653/m.5391 type:complete len:86 (+) Transcript_2653:250-507(+)
MRNLHTGRVLLKGSSINSTDPIKPITMLAISIARSSTYRVRYLTENEVNNDAMPAPVKSKLILREDQLYMTDTMGVVMVSWTAKL